MVGLRGPGSGFAAVDFHGLCFPGQGRFSLSAASVSPGLSRLSVEFLYRDDDLPSEQVICIRLDFGRFYDSRNATKIMLYNQHGKSQQVSVSG